MRKLLLCLLLITFKSFGQTLETDRLALVALYNGFIGDSYPELANWNVPGNTGDSPCGWYGVTCEGGRVTKLVLKELLLDGQLAPEVGNLTALKTLDISKSGTWMGNVTGDLPIQLGNLTNLEYLYIADQVFNSTSLSVIGSLTNLKGLSLLPTGEIPANFANLVNLETLYLGSGDPMGGMADFSFPSHLSTLPKLRELYFEGWVKGELPAVIGNFSNLEVLSLKTNGFPNVTPLQIGNLTKLKRLYISRYQGLGDFSFLSNLLNLEELELHDSYFSATLPADIGNLTKLRKIIIGSADFHGPIPSSISNLPNLTELNLHYNSFSGPIPTLTNIPVSGNVNLSENAFTFEGMESNISRLDQYGQQAKIVVTGQFVGPGTRLTALAGGTLANNTYAWYRDNVLISTNTGNNTLMINDDAAYRVEVTNSVVVGLKLISYNYRNVAFPVALVSFEGKSENNQTKLTWKTASETNNKGFEIERSTDARTFEKIGFVDGSGDTKENQSYHFTDLSPPAISYYRLKQLDYDGKFEYSKIIRVKGDQVVFKIYPNPAQDNLIVSGIDGEQDLHFLNSTGRVVMVTKVSAGQPVSIRSLNPGLYTIKVGSEGGKVLISR